MKGNKVNVKIEMESLSIDVLCGMLSQVSEQVSKGAESGEFIMDDGDCIKWKTTRTSVEF